MLDLTKRLITIPSVSYHEMEIVRFISSLLGGRNIPHVVDTFNPRDYSSSGSGTTANIYVDTWADRSSDTVNEHDTLMLYAHMDVVKAEDHQFNPVVEDGRLFGRGTADMKTALAGLVHVLSQDYEMLRALDKRLLFTFIADEETTHTGIMRFVDQYKGGSLSNLYCLVMEPTNNFRELDVGGKGTCHFYLEGSMKNVLQALRGVLEKKPELLGGCADQGDGFGPTTLSLTKVSPVEGITSDGLETFNGVSCHASRPYQGENALELALQHYKDLTYVATPESDSPNTIPSRAFYFLGNKGYEDTLCEAYIDIRTNLVADKSGSLKQQMQDLLREYDVSFKIRTEAPTVSVEDRTLVDVCKGAVDYEVAETIAKGCTDASYMGSMTRNVIPGFGPGGLSQCHKADESISLSLVRETPEVIRRVITNFNAR
jgi:acetylornithine deacetylase/succinyl-diaminopimelate desuccinylase-like protein